MDRAMDKAIRFVEFVVTKVKVEQDEDVVVKDEVRVMVEKAVVVRVEVRKEQIEVTVRANFVW